LIAPTDPDLERAAICRQGEFDPPTLEGPRRDRTFFPTFHAKVDGEGAEPSSEWQEIKAATPSVFQRECLQQGLEVEEVH
jgi:hypothetical protein